MQTLGRRGTQVFPTGYDAWVGMETALGEQLGGALLESLSRTLVEKEA